MRTSGAGRRGSATLSPRASPGRAICTVGQPPPVRVGQLHHRARRVHAQRPRLVQRQARRGAKLEGDRDGRTTTARWTWAPWGPPTIPGPAARDAKRNFLATLILSRARRLLGGDEMGRTQGGNDNAWCRSNEIWCVDWEVDEAGDGCSTSSPPDRAAPPAPRFGAGSSCTGHRQEGYGLPDACGPARRAASTSATRPDAHVVGSRNGEEIAAPARQRRRVVDSVSCCCSTARTRSSTSSPAHPLRAPLDGRPRTTDDPESPARCGRARVERVFAARLSLMVLQREN